MKSLGDCSNHMLEMIIHIPVIPVTATWHVSDVDDTLAAAVPMAAAVCVIVSATAAVVAAAGATASAS